MAVCDFFSSYFRETDDAIVISLEQSGNGETGQELASQEKRPEMTLSEVSA